MSISRRRFASSFAAVFAACMVVLSLPGLHAEDATTLALPERRALKQYQETKFPEEQKSIQAAAGFDVPLEVKWESIARPGEGASYLRDEYWTNIFFTPLAAALKKITGDEMGAKALKDKLKKIVITYDKSTAPVSNYPNGVSFEDGTLTINFEPFTNAADTEPRTKAISAALEKKL